MSEPEKERSTPGKIHQAMAAIMAEVGPVAKKKNSMGHKTRNIDDVCNEIHPILARHGVYTMSRVVSAQHAEKESKGGGTLLFTRLHMALRFVADDGSWDETEAYGEAMDSGDKAGNKAMSAAFKYALAQAFCLPTEAVDSDDEPQPEPKAGTKTASPPDRKGVSLDANHENGDGYSARLKGPANSEQLKEIMALAVDLYGSKEAASEKLQAILNAKGLAKPADLTYGDADGLVVVLKKKLSERDLPFGQTSQPAQQI